MTENPPRPPEGQFPEPGYQPSGYQPPPPGYSPPPPGYQPPPAFPPPGGYQPSAGQPSAGQPWAGQPPAGEPSEPSLGQQFANFNPRDLQTFDPKTVHPLDWGIVAAGVLALLFSFFAYYTYTVSITGLARLSASGSASAWHGLFGWLSALAAFAAAVVLAAQLVAGIRFAFPVRLAVLAGFGFALLCALLALVVVPGPSSGMASGLLGIKVDKGHGVGYWISLLAILAGTGLSFLRFTQAGGTTSGKG